MDAKGYGTRKVDSEKARPHTEEEMIKIENINGKLILIGADDDGLK